LYVNDHISSYSRLLGANLNEKTKSSFGLAFALTYMPTSRPDRPNRTTTSHKQTVATFTIFAVSFHKARRTRLRIQENEVFQCSIHASGSNVYCTRNEERIYPSKATKMARSGYGLRFQCAIPQRSTVQRDESLLSDVEIASGRVDGGEINPPACVPVGQLPTFAAVGRAPFGVECATEIWEVGEIMEMRVCISETVRPI